MSLLPDDAVACQNPTCGLWAQAQYAGIRGRRLRAADSPSTDCVLVVGQSPGYQEDLKNTIFVGKSGQVLTCWYLKYLPMDLDIWATNAVKCIPPYKTDPTVRHVKACTGYLALDIRALQAKYERVWVLCLGRFAALAILGVRKLKAAFGTQGRTVAVLPWSEALTRPVTVYTTYHPAMVLRQPKTTLTSAIKDHLALLSDATRGVSASSAQIEDWTPETFLAQLALPMPPPPGAALCVDIETYGIRPWGNQTQFNPHSSAAIDGVPYDEQIVSAAFATKVLGLPGYPIRTTALLATQPPRMVPRILDVGICHGWPILGTNLLFDLSYLIGAYPELGAHIATRKPLLIDLCVLAFLQNPDRPELSLKDLTPLLLRDDSLKYQSKGEKYADDTALLAYNRKDAINPLLLSEILLGRMDMQGLPPDPWKAIRFYSDVLHTLLHMTMVGTALDAKGVGDAFVRWHRRTKTFEDQAPGRRGIPVAGTGSVKAVRALFDEAAQAIGSGVRWELSPKTGIISTGKSNMRRALFHPKTPRHVRRSLRTVRQYRSARKLVSSYLEPLLFAATRNPIVHPSYFPVPSSFNADGDEEFGGGTRHGRITCKRPALQTAPATVQALMTTRYKGGVLASWDYSQLELRILALLSGDEELLRVFREGRDLHQETLEFVLGRQVSRDEPGYDRKRRQAKYTNFGVVYGISAVGLREAWWKYAGVDAPVTEAARFIHGFKRKYPRVPELHAKWIADVRRTGHLVLPITGHWLSFADPILAGTLDKAILNYPVQYTAAAACLVGQGRVIEEFRKRQWGVSPLNVHDAVLGDLRSGAYLRAADECVRDVLVHNWYVDALFEHYGREVPLEVDMKVLSWG